MITKYPPYKTSSTRTINQVSEFTQQYRVQTNKTEDEVLWESKNINYLSGSVSLAISGNMEDIESVTINIKNKNDEITQINLTAESTYVITVGDIIYIGAKCMGGDNAICLITLSASLNYIVQL